MMAKRTAPPQLSIFFGRHKCGQDVVNAQICINRAVFELNSKGRRDDIQLARDIAWAIEDLGRALKLLLSSRPSRSGRKKKGK